MTLSLKTLLRHAADSLRAPREQAQWVMSLDLSRRERWMSLAAISVVSTIISVLLEIVLRGEIVFLLGLVEVTPMVGAIATFSNAVITVFIVYWAGRAFGGKGGFGNTISIVAWLQFILACILAIQLLLAVVAPPLRDMSDIVALVAIFWLFSHFVAALHGFRSALNVFFAAMAISAGFVFGLIMLARLMGLAVTGVPS